MAEVSNPLAVACEKALRARLMALDANDPGNEAARVLLSRILGFRFRDYPDYTAPWHLLTWQHMRWWHVYHVVQIIEALRQPTGGAMGEPIVLQPFQIAILLAFLGPEDPATGLRIVKDGLLTLARKNGKTALIAGMTLALMCLHEDDHGLKGQDIQVGASDRDQAGITHQMVERFIQMDEALGIADSFRSVPSKKTVSHLRTLTQLRCLSSDAHRHHGGNPAIVLLDEMGNVTASAAEEFYSVLTTGFGAQTEPLTLLFSTQAASDQHFFSQMVDRAKGLNERRVTEDSFAGFVFALPETVDDGAEVNIYDESLWYLANPGIDTILSRQDIRDWAKRAKDMPSLENKYRLLKLNQRVSATSAFLSRTAWKACAGPVPEFADLTDRPCYLGIDLSETTDLTSVVALFEPELPGEPMPALCWFWIPGDDLQGRVHRDKVPYDVWSRMGLIDTTSHRVIEYPLVADTLLEIMESCDVKGIGFDRWKMKYLLASLRERGFDPDDGFMVEIGQGFRDQSRSIDVLEQLVLKGQVAHGDHPILNWNVANAVVVRDPAGNRKFAKDKSYGRIDGCVALALAAHVRDYLGVEQIGPSVYEDESRAVFM